MENQDKNQEKNKGGRPKNELGKVKNRTVSVRLTEQEYADLEIKAAASGHASIGAFLIASGVAREASRPRRKDQVMANQALYVQLTRIGSNINQLAKIANQTGSIPDLNALEELAEVLNSIRSEVLDDR